VDATRQVEEASMKGCRGSRGAFRHLARGSYTMS
jgi:hypothetical protein